MAKAQTVEFPVTNCLCPSRHAKQASSRPLLSSMVHSPQPFWLCGPAVVAAAVEGRGWFHADTLLTQIVFRMHACCLHGLVPNEPWTSAGLRTRVWGPLIYRKHDFSVGTPGQWNNISLDIWLALILLAFPKAFKNWLFFQALRPRYQLNPLYVVMNVRYVIYYKPQLHCIIALL